MYTVRSFTTPIESLRTWSATRSSFSISCASRPNARTSRAPAMFSSTVLARLARPCCTSSVPGPSRLKKRTLSHVTTGYTAMASTASNTLVRTSITNAPMAISR